MILSLINYLFVTKCLLTQNSTESMSSKLQPIIEGTYSINLRTFVNYSIALWMYGPTDIQTEEIYLHHVCAGLAQAHLNYTDDIPFS